MRTNISGWQADDRSAMHTVVTPRPSRATRRRSLRGETSHRGHVVLQKSGAATETQFESGLERKAILVNGMRRDVVDVVEQPRRVRYLDQRGVACWWTFDQRVVLEDGQSILVEVKPRAKAQRRKLLETLAHIAAQIPHGVATGVTLMHEGDVPRASVADATLFAAVRRDPPSNNDAAIAALAATFVGAVTVASLVEASGLGAQGFRAVARLVADGALAKVGGAKLGYSSLVESTTGGAK